MNFNAVLDLPREIQCCPGRHQRQFNAVRKAQGLVQCFPGLHRFKFRFNLDPFYTDRFIVVFEPKSFPDSAELSRFFFKFNVVKLKCVNYFYIRCSFQNTGSLTVLRHVSPRPIWHPVCRVFRPNYTIKCCVKEPITGFSKPYCTIMVHNSTVYK